MAYDTLAGITIPDTETVILAVLADGHLVAAYPDGTSSRYKSEKTFYRYYSAWCSRRFHKFAAQFSEDKEVVSQTIKVKRISEATAQ